MLHFFRDFTANIKNTFQESIERIGKRQSLERGRSQKIQRHIDEELEAFKQLQ